MDRQALRSFATAVLCVSFVVACGVVSRSGDSAAPPASPATPATLPRSAAAPRASPVADLDRVAFMTSGWHTDFSRHTVPLQEVDSGGPPRDGIPPIDHPKFETVTQGDGWLKPQEPVIAMSLGGETRVYPLQILIWHEIVNDVVGGVPVLVSFCPLCNTAIAFDRRLDGRVLDFGTTGNLRRSDLAMWDRQTESW